MTPTPRARALAKELRAAREAAALSQTRVGAVLGWSKHKVSRMELAKFTPKQDELGAILDTFSVQGKDRDRLMRLARESDDRAWWETNTDSAQFAAFVDAEDRACRIVQSSVNVIPGLLQTRNYARTVIERHDGERDVDRGVAVRIMRQDVLTRVHPVEYVAYLDESCLARRVGGPEIMAEQCRTLSAFARRRNVALRVMPFAYGAYESMVGGFQLMSFVRDESVVSLEQAGLIGIIADPDGVAPFFRSAHVLKESAMGKRESLAMIADYTTRYESELP